MDDLILLILFLTLVLTIAMFTCRTTSPAGSRPILPCSTTATLVNGPICTSFSLDPLTLGRHYLLETALQPGLATLVAYHQAELAASLVSSINSLSKTVSTLAEDSGTPNLMENISSVAGTITSLAKVVETLGRSDVTERQKKNPPSERAHTPSQNPKLRPSSCAPTARDPYLGEEHMRNAIPKSGAIDLKAKDHQIVNLQKQNRILLKKTTLWKVFNDVLINEFEEREVVAVRTHRHEMKELERAVCSLAETNSSVVADNKRLLGENMTFKDGMKCPGDTHQRTADENSLHINLLAEHQKSVLQVGRLTRELQVVGENEHRLEQKLSNMVGHGTVLVQKTDTLGSEVAQYSDKVHQRLIGMYKGAAPKKDRSLQTEGERLASKMLQINQQQVEFLLECKRLTEWKRRSKSAHDEFMKKELLYGVIAPATASIAPGENDTASYLAFLQRPVSSLTGDELQEV